MFKGSLPALVTPFGESGVDFDALKAIVEWHIEQGSHGVVAVGTTGESPTLSHEEHEEVVKVVTETAAKRIPVIAGAGSNNTDESLRLVKFAKSVGADAVLVVTPYYNKPTQQGLYEHYKDASRLVRNPDNHIQHTRSVGYRHEPRHDGTTRAARAHCRSEGRNWRRDASVETTADLRRATSSSFPARTQARSASTPTAESVAFRSRPTLLRGSAPSSRTRSLKAITPPRSNIRTGSCRSIRRSSSSPVLPAQNTGCRFLENAKTVSGFHWFR